MSSCPIHLENSSILASSRPAILPHMLRWLKASAAFQQHARIADPNEFMWRQSNRLCPSLEACKPQLPDVAPPSTTPPVLMILFLLPSDMLYLPKWIWASSCMNRYSCLYFSLNAEVLGFYGHIRPSSQSVRSDASCQILLS